MHSYKKGKMETADPVTGLTAKERKAVTENWNQLRADWKTNVVEFFIRLFKKYPETRTFFKTFDGMDIEDIRKSSKMRAHASNFSHGMSAFIDNLDDPDCLVVLIQKLAENHFRRRIRFEHFQDAFALFIEVAQDLSTVDELTAGAWKKTLDVVAMVISQHMTALEQKKEGN